MVWGQGVQPSCSLLSVEANPGLLAPSPGERFLFHFNNHAQD